jgi:hypothetical protein
MNQRLAVVFFSSFFALAGCAAEASSPGEAQDAVTSVEASGSGYLQVTGRDPRKCSAPLCGGWFVKRVNADKTLCADGTEEAECYVGSIDLAGIGLSEREEADVRIAIDEGKAILEANTIKKSVGGETVGVLQAKKVWLGEVSSAPKATFYRATSKTATELNTDETRSITGVTLPSKDARTSNALASQEGLIVAATLEANALTATAFFLRVVRREGQSCGGFAPSLSDCNGGQFCNWARADMCGAGDASGRCTYKPAACPRFYEPVCGCDGQTHGNECEANAAGTSVARAGACQTAP